MNYKTAFSSIFISLFIICSLLLGQSTKNNLHLKFDLGSGKVQQGYVQVLPGMKYTQQRGYGFYSNSAIQSVERNNNDKLRNDFVTSEGAFIFTVDVPEGNYDVIITLGDAKGKSITTIKAESRRLMIEEVSTSTGEFKNVVFTTNVRYSKIDSNTSVKLKPREIGHLNWDQQLSIEFNNARPCICAIEIIQNRAAVTIFLAGNSTVTDQRYEPWASWGQMLPAFFKAQKIAVANHAESGEALKSFIGENRLKKIFSKIRQGDYLFIQFAHNDQKPQSSAYVKPFQGYKEYLKDYIKRARKYGAIPVLVTPMYRRKFDKQGRIVNTHGDYPEAMRQVAKEENVALIDLFNMSGILFESLGVEGSKKAFVHYPAGMFPNEDKELKDNSHFNNYGAYQLAKCIIEGIKLNQLALVKYLREDLPSYNPVNPDPVADWEMPLSPLFSK